MAFLAMAMLMGAALAGLASGADTADDGTAEAERYDGTAEDERYDAAAGDDLLRGLAGDDTLAGGDGNDWLIGGDGQDELKGGNGDDVIVGGDDADRIEAGAGDDFVEVSNLIDEAALDKTSAQAESFADIDFSYDLSGEPDVGDHVDLGAGDDTVVLGSDDTLTGGEGSDHITLGDWIAPGNPAHIDDFDSAEDVLVLSFDARTSEPEISIESDETGDSTLIRTDGVTLAVLHGVYPGHITSDIRVVAY